jgi:uncharacterized protein involved in exopolysaccharide biosynthesis
MAGDTTPTVRNLQTQIGDLKQSVDELSRLLKGTNGTPGISERMRQLCKQGEGMERELAGISRVLLGDAEHDRPGLVAELRGLREDHEDLEKAFHKTQSPEIEDERGVTWRWLRKNIMAVALNAGITALILWIFAKAFGIAP